MYWEQIPCSVKIEIAPFPFETMSRASFIGTEIHLLYLNLFYSYETMKTDYFPTKTQNSLPKIVMKK